MLVALLAAIPLMGEDLLQGIGFFLFIPFGSLLLVSPILLIGWLLDSD